MNKNITYLIGAGASYHSLPVVDSMNDRMACFLHLLNPTNQTSRNSHYRKFTGKLYESFNRLMIEANRHKTIDTYAKKLWLTGRTDDLTLLKVLLDLYFTFEQDINRSIYLDKSIFHEKDENTLWPKIGKLLDYRYDVFFATLLSKTLLLPDNINIVSWNYDNQFEIAYNEFLGGNNNVGISKNLRIFSNNGNELEDPQIIKLNGQTNIFGIDVTNKIVDLSSKLDSILHNYNNIDIQNYQTSISFAWEIDSNENAALEKAKEVFNYTDELIIIGYSFPTFNRAIDAELFSNLRNVDKVNVQCLSNDYNSIAASIADMPNWESPEHFEGVVKLHDNLDQFYIPSIQLMN